VPFSVIVGLALLPLTIPMLWLIGPVAVGTQPALTLATPVSLAVSAAALCLAVAYTVDWSPVTRIKGVLTLVGLAYFAGLSLYFLKRETAEWAQHKLAAKANWKDFQPPTKEYGVALPGPPQPGKVALVQMFRLDTYRAVVRELGQEEVYTVGAGPDPDPEADDDAWFTAVEQSIRNQTRGTVEPDPGVPATARLPNRTWVATPPNGADMLIVQVYRDKTRGRVYVLEARGRDVSADDEDVERFFRSFAVTTPKK
jgi:hypothetical protein